MSFFHISNDNEDLAERWVVSEKFWLFWVTAIPLTALTMGLWTVWQVNSSRRAVQSVNHELHKVTYAS